MIFPIGLNKDKILLPYNLNGKTINAFNKECTMTGSDIPFRNIVIDNLLKEEVHEDLKKEFKSIPVDFGDKYKGERDTDNPLFVGYGSEHHKAYRMNLNPNFGLKHNFFQNMAWKDFVQSLAPDIPLENYLLTEMHNHQGQSPHGFVHLDFNPSKFDNKSYNGENRIFDGIDTAWNRLMPNECGICDGKEESFPFLAWNLTTIYYVGYGPKLDEDKPAGGHTALFWEDDHIYPAKGISPIENRLALFENSPWSWHASRSNNSEYRYSIYNWWNVDGNFLKDKYPDFDLCSIMRTEYNKDKYHYTDYNGEAVIEDE